MKKSILLLAALLFHPSSFAGNQRFVIQNGRPGTLERAMNEIVVSPALDGKVLVQIENGLSTYKNGIEAQYSTQNAHYEFASALENGEDCTYFGCQGIDSFSGYATADKVVLTVKFFEDDGEPNLRYFKETSTYLLQP